MDKVIVYVDDAAYAQQVLGPLFAKSTRGASAARTQWVLVACAPRMTHRISKWVSHSARENWRTKWADKLFAQIVPLLRAPAGSVTTVLAKGPLNELTDQLQAAQEGGAAQVVDARRPKTDAATEPQRPERRWPSPRPGTLLSSLLTTGFGALWVLTLD